MGRSNYKRLGDYIQQVDVRNKDLSVDKLVGLTIGKAFIDSVANTIGTDFSKYKIIEAEQFACSLMQVSRDNKIPIAMYVGDEKAILSPAYSLFEVIDKSKLLPSYLMMWFRRSEFDREASFYAVGGVRGSLSWDDFLDFYLPIPDIDVQRAIVAQYETITRRIALNERICTNLEKTAQALYNKMFIQDIDPDNLPDGWRIGTIKEFCKDVKSGGTPSRTSVENWNKHDFPWIKSGEVQNNIILSSEEYISEIALRNSSAKIIPADSVIMAMYGGGTVGNVGYLAFETTTNQACCNMICNTKEDAAYLYFYLRANQDKISRLANGGAQENLNQSLIVNQPIILGADISPFLPFITEMIVLNKMIIRLKTLQHLLVQNIINKTKN